MNRAGLIVVFAALIVAVVTAWQPAEAQEASPGGMTPDGGSAVYLNLGTSELVPVYAFNR